MGLDLDIFKDILLPGAGFLIGGPTGAALGASIGQAAGAGEAAKEASAAQQAAAKAGIAELRQQFGVTEQRLDPFAQAGLGALRAQQAFLGLPQAPVQVQAPVQAPVQAQQTVREQREALISPSFIDQGRLLNDQQTRIPGSFDPRQAVLDEAFQAAQAKRDGVTVGQPQPVGSPADQAFGSRPPSPGTFARSIPSQISAAVRPAIDQARQIAQAPPQGDQFASAFSLDPSFGPSQIAPTADFTATPEELASFQQFTDIPEITPGQDFIRQRQERALARNAGRFGGTGGGNVLTALQEQAAGFAQQDVQFQREAQRQARLDAQRAAEFQQGFRQQGLQLGEQGAQFRQQAGRQSGLDLLQAQQFQQQSERQTQLDKLRALQGLTASGQQASTNLGVFGSTLGSNVAGLLGAGGLAEAQGIQGQQQAKGNLLGTVGSAFLGAGAAGSGLLGPGATTEQGVITGLLG